MILTLMHIMIMTLMIVDEYHAYDGGDNYGDDGYAVGNFKSREDSWVSCGSPKDKKGSLHIQCNLLLFFGQSTCSGV